MYQVEFLTVVDRPELRSVTLPVVAVNKALPTILRYPTLRQAVIAFDEICRGEYDFASEYVEKVRIVKPQVNASARIVRKQVERMRKAVTPPPLPYSALPR